MKNPNLDAALEHYAKLKKDREKKLELLRKEFPHMPVEKILEKYRYDTANNTTASSK